MNSPTVNLQKINKIKIHYIHINYRIRFFWFLAQFLFFLVVYPFKGTPLLHNSAHSSAGMA